MKLATCCMVSLLIAGSIGVAQADVMIQNGDFSQTSPVVTTPTQFGTGSLNGFTAIQFITGWTGNDGYEIWYPNATDATTVNATSEWTSTGKEMLYGPIAAPPGATAFVGLDGDQEAGVQSSISQQINGLTPGATYMVSFSWAAAQLQSRTGDTQSSLLVSLGGDSLSTGMLANPSESFSGWKTAQLSFTAGSDSEPLNFLSVGTPGGLPPVALLTNVSITKVAEPSELALFGGGLLGLGLLTLVARRRSLHPPQS